MWLLACRQFVFLFFIHITYILSNEGNKFQWRHCICKGGGGKDDLLFLLIFSTSNLSQFASFLASRNAFCSFLYFLLMTFFNWNSINLLIKLSVTKQICLFWSVKKDLYSTCLPLMQHLKSPDAFCVFSLNLLMILRGMGRDKDFLFFSFSPRTLAVAVSFPRDLCINVLWTHLSKYMHIWSSREDVNNDAISAINGGHTEKCIYLEQKLFCFILFSLL